MKILIGPFVVTVPGLVLSHWDRFCCHAGSHDLGCTCFISECLALKPPLHIPSSFLLTSLAGRKQHKCLDLHHSSAAPGSWLQLGLAQGLQAFGE